MFVYITFLIRVHNPSKPIKIVSTRNFALALSWHYFDKTLWSH